jgi:Fe-S cluster assembly ATP-binding protein
MLEIRELSVSIGDKPILNGIDLTVPSGEVHAIMGPNGSGKSTLGYVLAGREDYTVTSGSVTFNGMDLLDVEPEQRAAAGVFLAFQAPIELPGVNNGPVPEARARRDQTTGDAGRHVEAQRECWLLGW